MVQLRLNFRSRTFCYPEKFNKFLISSPSESFGNIGTNADRRSSDLLSEAKVIGK